MRRKLITNTKANPIKFVNPNVKDGEPSKKNEFPVKVTVLSDVVEEFPIKEVAVVAVVVFDVVALIPSVVVTTFDEVVI